MPTAHMPPGFYDLIAYLPPERPAGPAGGRPRVGHLQVIWLEVIDK